MDGPRDMISVTVLETQALFKLQRLNCRDFSSGLSREFAYPGNCDMLS